MSYSLRFAARRVQRRSAGIGVEGLESRALLATSTATIATGFVAPDLSNYVNQALYGHQNTGPATIKTMENALQSQLTTGVLTALQGGTLTPADFQTSVYNVVGSYAANVKQQLSGFKNITGILIGQAQGIQQVIHALNTQLNVGLITTTVYTAEAAQAINAVTGGPLFPLNTPATGYATATTALETQLNLLPPSLATTASPKLTLAQVKTVARIDAEAYRVTTNAALYVNPNLSAQVNAALNTFESSVNAITATATLTPAQQLTNAITALDATLLDSNGLFGPKGPLRR